MYLNFTEKSKFIFEFQFHVKNIIADFIFLLMGVQIKSKNAFISDKRLAS